MRAWLLASLVLVPTLYAIAPHALSDADALSRIATGRLLATHGLALPKSDPFTFADPKARFGDPEWLGDLGLYALFDQLGANGLQTVVLLMAAVGFVLALGLGIALGAPAYGMLALLLCTLPAVGPRVAARNDVHDLWIVPLFCWLAYSASRARERARRRYWIALLALGFLWANLHASFVLGWPLLLAALVDTDKTDRKDWLPWCVIGIYPALPWLGLAGSSTYLQLLDHTLGADVYRSLISEWQSPLSSGGLLAILPLHVLCLLGVVYFVSERKRVRWLPLAMFLLGIALTYRSRRFLPLMAALIAPAVGAGLAVVGARIPAKAARRALAWLAWACVLAYVGLGLRSALHRPAISVLGASETPERAARFMLAHAPNDARVANVFNDGPWLVFISAPRVRHYLDPRNDLGAALLARYVDDVLPEPSHFEAEVARLDITLALMREGDTRSATLAAYLASETTWPLVYWDGWHALHAHRVAANAQLIQRFAYRMVRASLDFAYLDALPANDAVLEQDLRMLERQSPPLAQALRAYRLLRRGDRDSALQATRLFETALPELPALPSLLGYWQEASERTAAVSGEP
jgi:hypothetical protein